MSKKPKTQDLEWLIHSLMAFNGTGYADMNSAQDYFESYIVYKRMKNKPEAVFLAERYHDIVIPTIDELLARTYGASRVPTQKAQARFNAYRTNIQSSLLK